MEEIFEIDILELSALVKMVREKYHFDLKEYALSSLSRRIKRILEMFNLSSIKLLTSKIENDPVLFEKFLNEITVNTTEMFRDPLVWKHLREHVFPELAKLPEIRIWHSACSTGEEVFSMAIALREAGLDKKATLFASDINNEVIANAKLGKFPLRTMEHSQSNYEKSGGAKKFAEYYTARGIDAYFDLSLIQNVTFKKFDLILGKQTEQFDLILCRNVLIYFNLPLQDQIIEKFAHCQKENAFLMTGARETIIWCKSADYYDVFSQDFKIFQRNTK
jgi:chemotaxis protein methyltransferase CheR